MENKLFFNNGASFALFPVDALDAPRMPGWRHWHVTATNADAVAALESGLYGREYESITGRDEEGNAIVETMREDLSGYVVPGSVCDHMDGTVTIFARKMTALEQEQNARQVYADSLYELGVDLEHPAESTAARVADIRALTATADLTEKSDVIINMPPSFCDEWVPGMELKKGRLVELNAVKYLVVNDVTAQAHYPPDMPNGAMLSVYKPYQGKYNYTWLYGEYCEPGFTRYEDEKLYLCYQDPVANIYPPSQNPNCWKVVEE
jgi:hypothetical protein